MALWLLILTLNVHLPTVAASPDHGRTDVVVSSSPDRDVVSSSPDRGIMTANIASGFSFRNMALWLLILPLKEHLPLLLLLCIMEGRMLPLYLLRIMEGQMFLPPKVHLLTFLCVAELDHLVLCVIKSYRLIESSSNYYYFCSKWSRFFGSWHLCLSYNGLCLHTWWQTTLEIKRTSKIPSAHNDYVLDLQRHRKNKKRAAKVGWQTIFLVM